MTIKASIVADSINPSGNRLTTWLLYYPRFIHSEVMTHRVFARNSASSRAIPIETMIKRVLGDPVIPIWWGKAQKGMQAYEEVDFDTRDDCETEWLWARDEAVEAAREMSRLGLHKQVTNRLLEPWMHIEVVLSGTEFKNFFQLRDHHAAEPHIRELAHIMREMYGKSEPVLRQPIDLEDFEISPCQYLNGPLSLTSDSWWHLPFIGEGAYTTLASGDTTLLNLIKESVAHCAWVSYGNLEGKTYTQEDVNRVYDLLLGSQPIHASPAEHVAVACNGPHRHGPFVGWASWRSFLPGESGGDYAA